MWRSEEEVESLSPAQIHRLRAQKINQKKLHIASLGSAIVSDPVGNVSADLRSRFCAEARCVTWLLVGR